MSFYVPELSEIWFSIKGIGILGPWLSEGEKNHKLYRLGLRNYKSPFQVNAAIYLAFVIIQI